MALKLNQIDQVNADVIVPSFKPVHSYHYLMLKASLVDKLEIRLPLFDDLHEKRVKIA